MRCFLLLALFLLPVHGAEPSPALRTFLATFANLDTEQARTRATDAFAKLAQLAPDQGALAYVRAFRALVTERETRQQRLIPMQKRGAAAYALLMDLTEDLKRLQARIDAGAKRLRPQLAQVQREYEAEKRKFEDARTHTRAAMTISRFLYDFETSALRLAGERLRLVPADKWAACVTGLRAEVPLTPVQSGLRFVALLRGSGQPQAAVTLLQLARDVKQDVALRRSAISGVGAVGDRDALRALVEIWEADARSEKKALGARLRIALSSAAKQRLVDPAAARAWLQGLEKK